MKKASGRPASIAARVQKQASSKNETATSRLAISIFSTPLGWIGLVGQDDRLVAIFVGHSSAKSVRMAAAEISGSIDDADWNPDLRLKVDAYSEGDPVNFADVEIQLPSMTKFRHQVVAATRRLRYGETVTYGELARRAGYPGAARAVGSTMAANRFPIVIPCHRVTPAGGKLGQYTCPAGSEFRRRLLKLEGRDV